MNPIGLISMQYARPFTAEHFHLFRKMRELGFDFVELLVPEPGEINLAETRRALDDAGLGVVLAARVNMQRNLSSDEKNAHRAGIDYLRYTADCAAELGATVVGGPLTGNPLVFAGRAPLPVSEDERLARKDRCVAGLQEAGDHAAKMGILLAVEPLNRFESDVLCTTQQAIRLGGDHLVHFQANENHRGFPGTGSTDWVAVCRALHEVNYKGPISLEPFRRNDDRFGVPFAQWRPPHEDESERLAASAAFIKSHLILTEYRR